MSAAAATREPTVVDAAVLRAWPLPGPEGSGGKEARGRVLVVGGSRELPGPALLAGRAVLRVGAGKLQLGVPRSVGIALGVAMPEALVAGLPENDAGSLDIAAADRVVKLAARCRALLIGPGLAEDDDTASLTREVLEQVENVPVVVDAAAMMRLFESPDAIRRHTGRLILTPHAGEMAGMTGRPVTEIEADPAAVARTIAAEFGAVVVLKGACSFIAAPDGRAFSCGHGNVGLATSGSGDTLAGLIAGLLGRGADPLQAAAWGVFLHGEAGNRLAARIGPLGFLARELPDEVPAILADLGRDPQGGEEAPPPLPSRNVRAT